MHAFEFTILSYSTHELHTSSTLMVLLCSFKIRGRKEIAVEFYVRIDLINRFVLHL